ncbi:hypothetical protein [Amycolatopsis solani]|uniref:hypothetical protein n=1 Tax=Amycolatopsis solani TaxID=3028615 RepID=UPI0025AEE802|nr:hypothetical protein [Amycolatopsis sp. MEP2-6]
MYNESLIPIILLLSSGKEVQRRSQQAVLLNTIPIASNMRGTIGALGAVQQAKQSLVDEAQAVNAAADLLLDVIQGGGTIDLARLQADAVLQRIASQEIADKLQAIVDLATSMPDGGKAVTERARPNGEESASTRRKAVAAGPAK